MAASPTVGAATTIEDQDDYLSRLTPESFRAACAASGLSVADLPIRARIRRRMALPLRAETPAYFAEGRGRSPWLVALVLDDWSTEPVALAYCSLWPNASSIRPPPRVAKTPDELVRVVRTILPEPIGEPSESPFRTLPLPEVRA